MSISNKILYIGAGLDLDVLEHFVSTKEFVFVDVQPRSEFDSPNSFYEGFYRKNFYPGLIELAREYGFELEKSEELDSDYFVNILDLTQRLKWLNKVKETFPFINPTLLIFFNQTTGQKLKYYMSTNILYNMYWDLENDIRSSDGLIISGFHPDKILLKYISSPINLYCYDETCYKLDDKEVDNFDNLIYWLFKNLDMVSRYFSNINMVEKENGIITKYDNMLELDIIVNKNYYGRMRLNDEQFI
jgi:hypothetical protein